MGRGAVAAAAGALVLGAVPRLRQNPTFSSGIAFSTGLALLANSRPYEGLILGISCMGALYGKVSYRFLVRPLAYVLLPVALWMAYYNYRVTGNPLLLPYRAHEKQYATWSSFVWDTSPNREPPYNHENLRGTWIGWEQMHCFYEREHPVRVRVGNLLQMNNFFLGLLPAMIILGLTIPMFRSDPDARTAILILVSFAIGVEMETRLWPHYVAPATALVFVLAAMAVRKLRSVSKPAMLTIVALTLLADAFYLANPSRRWLFYKQDYLAERRSILNTLQRSPGKHLVLVEYGPAHDINREWVYNRANIDAARIVWAHVPTKGRADELLAYYEDRNVWRFRDDGDGRLMLSLIASSRTR